MESQVHWPGPKLWRCVEVIRRVAVIRWTRCGAPFKRREYTQDRGHYGLNFGVKNVSTSLQNSFEHNSKSRSVSGRRKNGSTSCLFEHNSESRSVSGRRKNGSTSLQNSLFEHNSLKVEVFLEGEKTTQLRSKTASSSTTLFLWSLRGHYAVATAARSLRGHYGHYAVTTVTTRSTRSLRGHYGHYAVTTRSLRGHYAVTTVTTRSLRSLRGRYGHYAVTTVTTRSLRSLRSLRGHYAVTTRSLRGHYGHYAVTTVTTRSLRGHYAVTTRSERATCSRRRKRSTSLQNKNSFLSTKAGYGRKRLLDQEAK